MMRFEVDLQSATLVWMVGNVIRQLETTVEWLFDDDDCFRWRQFVRNIVFSVQQYRRGVERLFRQLYWVWFGWGAIRVFENDVGRRFCEGNRWICSGMVLQDDQIFWRCHQFDVGGRFFHRNDVHGRRCEIGRGFVFVVGVGASCDHGCDDVIHGGLFLKPYHGQQ